MRLLGNFKHSDGLGYHVACAPHSYQLYTNRAQASHQLRTTTTSKVHQRSITCALTSSQLCIRIVAVHSVLSSRQLCYSIRPYVHWYHASRAPAPCQLSADFSSAVHRDHFNCGEPAPDRLCTTSHVHPHHISCASPTLQKYFNIMSVVWQYHINCAPTSRWLCTVIASTVHQWIYSAENCTTLLFDISRQGRVIVSWTHGLHNASVVRPIWSSQWRYKKLSYIRKVSNL